MRFYHGQLAGFEYAVSPALLFLSAVRLSRDYEDLGLGKNRQLYVGHDSTGLHISAHNSVKPHPTIQHPPNKLADPG